MCGVNKQFGIICGGCGDCDACAVVCVRCEYAGVGDVDVWLS